MGIKKRAEKPRERGLYKRGQYWWVRYADSDGKLHCESSYSKNLFDARDLLAQRRTERRDGKRPELKEDKKITFTAFANDYRDAFSSTLKSWPTVEGLLKKPLEFFGHLRLDQLSVKRIQQYRNQRQSENAMNRKGKISPSTVNRELAIVRHVINIAVEWGVLRYNPMGGKLKMAKEPKQDRIFTDEEIGILIANADPPWKFFIALAINTGMREREIMGLGWDEIDFKQKLITLTAIRTKSQTTRHVPMNSTVKKILLGLKEEQGGSEFVFLNPASGKPYHWISKVWKRLLKRCKITPYGRFHDLRHTWATKAAEAGINPVSVQAILGHTDLRTTMRYFSATDKGKREAVEAVEIPV